MQRTISRQLKNEFANQITQALPQFGKCSGDDANQFGAVFHWDAFDDCRVFILLLISRLYDQFTVEMAWSSEHHYPLTMVPGIPIDMPQFNLKRDTPVRGSFRFRLGGLFHPKGDYWWLASSDMPLIAWCNDPHIRQPSSDAFVSLSDSVRASIRAVQQYGLPYIAGELQRDRDSSRQHPIG